MPIYRVSFKDPSVPDELVTADRLTLECSPTIYHRFARQQGASLKVVCEVPQAWVAKIVLEPADVLFDLP